MDKKALRTVLKDQRKKINMEALSIILLSKLKESKEYKFAKNIMLFYPLKHEVNLLSLLNDKTKNFYLPRIKGEELECCPYTIGDELKESCFYTQEPTSQACDKTKLDMVIVPALAVDKENYRLGYGGGFYDKFLADFYGIKVVCIPSQFVVETVYREKHDIKMDSVITELFHV